MNAAKLFKVRNLEDLKKEMRQVEQTKGLDLLEHGTDVYEKFLDILTEAKTALTNDIFKQSSDLKLPNWLYKVLFHCDFLAPLKIIRTYLIYHDCGKAFCDPSTEERKFPNHAAVSASVWGYMFAVGKNTPMRAHHERIALLMGFDMFLHTTKPSNLKACLTGNFEHVEFLNENWYILLVAALAEIHANADQFGGIDSDSFKIKWKRLNKSGEILCDHYLNKDRHSS